MKTVDLTFLLGQTVEQVCLDQYRTQVRREDATPLIECKHSVALPPGNDEIVRKCTGSPADGISKLLGQTVSGASFVGEKTLEVLFSSGIRLLVNGDEDQLESFQIRCGDVWIIA